MESNLRALGTLYMKMWSLRASVIQLRLLPLLGKSKSSSLRRMNSSSAVDYAGDEVLAEQGGNVGVAVLNRAKKLNSLTYNMVVRLHELYRKWEAEDRIVAVILKGNGRAFCAGGDVAKVCELGKQGLHIEANDFFYKEYMLNYFLATLKKPHVALLHGVVMGGGNGVSIHGKYRVATEKTLFAMPETALGLHPDVGASYFLSRLDGYLGEYLGLTGERLDGADMVATGLATHFVSSERLPSLENELRNISSSDSLEKTLKSFSENSSPRAGSCLHRLNAINSCFSKETVEDILRSLETSQQDDWYQGTITKLRKASPTSLKITLASIRKGRQESLAECLAREYRMSFRAVTGKYSKDFYEGCRAILIDKDNQPQWNPATLEEVSPKVVDGYFAELGDEGPELQLPVEEREKSSIRARI